MAIEEAKSSSSQRRVELSSPVSWQRRAVRTIAMRKVIRPRRRTLAMMSSPKRLCSSACREV